MTRGEGDHGYKRSTNISKLSKAGKLALSPSIWLLPGTGLRRTVYFESEGPPAERLRAIGPDRRDRSAGILAAGTKARTGTRVFGKPMEFPLESQNDPAVG